jgi:hypothetical protein
MVSFARRGERHHRGDNEVRPHSSLDYLTPNEFVAQQQDQRPAMQRAGALR